jgi:hypothetical protein
VAGAGQEAARCRAQRVARHDLRRPGSCRLIRHRRDSD